MSKRSKGKKISIVAIAGLFTASSTVIVGNALSASAVTINKVPTDVVRAEIESSTPDHSPMETKANVTIDGGTARVDNITDAGYYYVTFFTDSAEVGSVSFYIGESGKAYQYGYDGETEEKFVQAASFDYQGYSTVRILDISGENTVAFDGVLESAVSAEIHVSYPNGDYGDMTTSIKTVDGKVSISTLGSAGEYNISFMDQDGVVVDLATFTINEANEVMVADYTYDEASGEWVETFVPTDVVIVDSYEDLLSDISGTEDVIVTAAPITITGLSNGVASVDVQAFDADLNELYAEPEISLESGSVVIGNLYSGCYFVNFFDADGGTLGYAKFYLDDEGDLFDYEFENDVPAFTPITAVKYHAVAAEADYRFGNITVPIYGVPADIDSIESYYMLGDRTDESVMFEPEYSSVSIEPLTLRGLGQSGNYKISFFKDDQVVGNATFSIDDSGKVYETDYVYDSSTGVWEATLVESDGVYFFENTDIEDADDYHYGSTSFVISNVPSDVKMVESRYYGSDDSFTYGGSFFPNVKIQDGIVTITDLGEPGYYEFDLVKADEQTKVGYVFVYVDEKMDTYLYESSIDPDVMQLETTLTKTSSAKLSQYISGCVDYEVGKYEVTISGVTKTANNVLVTVVGEDDHYASFEKSITVDANGDVKLGQLGMNGDHTVVFFSGNDILGSARFYLKDGKVYTATYNEDHELQLTAISDVKFVASDDTITFELGDVDLTGDISVSDIVALQRYLLATLPLNASQLSIADMNSDDSIDVFDLALLKRRVLKER